MIINATELKSAESGEPIMANMEYYYPDQRMAGIIDQFMVGPDLIVAPMVTPGNFRSMFLPPGTWEADDGTVYEGEHKI